MIIVAIGTLQRSRALSSAEILPAIFGGRVIDMLQRSRALSSAEILSECDLVAHPTLASTEPRSFERGDGPLGARCEPRVNASTEPRSFERGDRLAQEFHHLQNHYASTEPRSFERGDLFCHLGRCYIEPASTEPRSFERGDDANFYADAGLPKLQRSRALSSAEMDTAPIVAAENATLQRSRALSSAEIRRGRVSKRSGLSFNGAALFRARRSRSEELQVERAWARASTEPRSFERGDSP